MDKIIENVIINDLFYLFTAKVGLSSTFSLILSSFASAQQRIFEALKCNSIPVIVGSQSVSNLPFGDFIDWNRAAIRLPRGRLADLVSILKQVPSQTILDMRRNGRFYMDHFLGDAKGEYFYSWRLCVSEFILLFIICLLMDNLKP